jgi:hypothetical protein
MVRLREGQNGSFSKQRDSQTWVRGPAAMALFGRGDIVRAQAGAPATRNKAGHRREVRGSRLAQVPVPSKSTEQKIMRVKKRAVLCAVVCAALLLPLRAGTEKKWKEALLILGHVRAKDNNLGRVLAKSERRTAFPSSRWAITRARAR